MMHAALLYDYLLALDLLQQMGIGNCYGRVREGSPPALVLHPTGRSYAPLSPAPDRMNYFPRAVGLAVSVGLRNET